MELNEYLAKSKEKRNELVKVAEVLLNKNLNQALGRNNIVGENTDLVIGPTPQKLKDFENAMSFQLKKIFTPGLGEGNKDYRISASGSVDEGIRKLYSRKSPTLKKQLVILPKNFYYSVLKVPERLTQKKNFSPSPEILTDSTIRSHREDTRQLTHTKKFNKQDLLNPILATIENYQCRSKIYKYK